MDDNGQHTFQQARYDRLLKEMIQRLPELEWKMSQLSRSLSQAILPKHLFPSYINPQPQKLVDDIKTEIERLKNVKRSLSAHYLAEKISQKIQVLVTYCNDNHTGASVRAPSSKSLLDELCTRNQFVEKTEEKIQRLQSQDLALKTRLAECKCTQESLKLTKELGELNKQLTLAKESLATLSF